MKKSLFLILILLFAGFTCFCQDGNAEKFASIITPEVMEDNLSILASDALEGRATGKRGQKMAATFIASYLEEIGLVPPVNGTYFQPVDLIQKSISRVTFRYGTKTEQITDDIAYSGVGVPPLEKANEVVFAGYGEEDDFERLNLKNKFVLVYAKDTIMSNLFPIVTRSVEKEATLILIPGNEAYSMKIVNQLRNFYESGIISLNNFTPTLEMFIFITPPSIGAKLMNTTPEDLVKVANDFDRKFNKIKSAKISYSIETEDVPIAAQNVLGIVEGTDKKDEIIVISSHYDHVGKIGTEGDIIYNGADDNGSGTVAVMNLAKAFAEAKINGNGPRRSILFIAFTAEEAGLLGSEFYTLNPIFPLDKTIANLNIDMIGRRDTIYDEKSSFVYLVGSDRLSTELHDISESANATYTHLELDYTYNDPSHPGKFLERSDQWNFMKNGIPVILYTDGEHEDYHKPSDDTEKIDFDLLAQRTKLVFYTAWQLANLENPIGLEVIDRVGQ